jgi:hypothetical protein
MTCVAACNWHTACVAFHIWCLVLQYGWQHMKPMLIKPPLTTAPFLYDVQGVFNAAKAAADAVNTGAQFVAVNTANAALAAARATANGVLTGTQATANAAQKLTLEGIAAGMGAAKDALSLVKSDSFLQLDAFELGMALSKTKTELRAGVDITLQGSKKSFAFALSTSDPIGSVVNAVKDQGIAAIKSAFKALASVL